MPDFDAIAIAIAARYTAAAVTAAGGPPAGLQNVRLSTADLPQAIGTPPVVLVFPDQGRFQTGGGTRVGAHSFLVRFYLKRSRILDRETPQLRRWLTLLADMQRPSTQLGGTVARVETAGWRAGILRYGGIDYAGLELTLDLTTTEGWSASS